MALRCRRSFPAVYPHSLPAESGSRTRKVEPSLDLPSVNNIIWTAMSIRQLNESTYGVSNEDQGTRQTSKPTLGCLYSTPRCALRPATIDQHGFAFVVDTRNHTADIALVFKMTHISNDEFLSQLAGLYMKSREKGAKSVYVAMKPYDGRTKAMPKDAEHGDDVHCLMRASLGSNKISTVVKTKDVNKFHSAYVAVLRTNMDNLEKDKKTVAPKANRA